MASTFNHTIYRGDTPSFTLTFTRAGTAFDIGGASVWFTAKRKVTDADADAVFQKTIGDGVTLTALGAGGIATATLAEADTESLPDHEVALEVDVQLLEADGTKTTTSRGVLRVRPDVSRA